jgi:peptidoglycan/xylan/chitin deacetylase (PgdA/CDA1 family)
MSPHAPRALTKRALAAVEGQGGVDGASLLIYHRVGGGTSDELDVTTDQFRAHLDALGGHDVVSLDTALDRIEQRDRRHSVVLTFDDGFADVYDNAWPLLRERHLPFTLYLATAYMGQPMVWENSTAKGPHGQGMTWAQLEEMVESGLCTIGNHTHSHVRPEALTVDELDRCTATVEHHLGVTPQHFTYPWGVPVPAIEPALAARFRSSSTGLIGRNDPHTDPQRLRRIPVRQSDPLPFFEAKLTGDLRAERAYERLVRTTKSLLRRIPG